MNGPKGELDPAWETQQEPPERWDAGISNSVHLS